jgi:hypothetical protein
MRAALILALLLPASCASLPRSLDAPVAASSDWRRVATASDRARLRDWRTAFTRALEQARKAGHSAEIQAEGRLLEPDAALGPVPIPNGNYKCRVIKVGAKSEGLLDYIAYPAFDCRIEQQGALHSFTKLTGSQRHAGLIFPDSPLRQAFLGTLVLGDETRAMQYGRDPDRDLAGWVERIGDNRWRLVLPYPRYESTLDVVELIPAR